MRSSTTAAHSAGTVPAATESRLWPLIGLASVAAIIGASAVTAIAYSGHDGEAYSALNHYISELGQLSQSRLALLFNVGLIAGAIGLTAFNLWLGRILPPRYGRPYRIVAVVSGIGGGLVGVFPMDYLGIHALVAFTFFLTGWILVVIFSVWQLRWAPPAFPRWLMAEAAVVVASFLAFIASEATARRSNDSSALAVITDRPSPVWIVPALEWLALLSLLAWFALVAAVLLRDAVRGGD